MTIEKNSIPFGAIDQIARMLEEVAPQMEALWDDGHYRMNKQEVLRLAEYLSRIRVSHSRLRDALKAFETLVDRHPVVLRKIMQQPEVREFLKEEEPQDYPLPKDFLLLAMSDNKTVYEA